MDRFCCCMACVPEHTLKHQKCSFCIIAKFSLQHSCSNPSRSLSLSFSLCHIQRQMNTLVTTNELLSEVIVYLFVPFVVHTRRESSIHRVRCLLFQFRLDAARAKPFRAVPALFATRARSPPFNCKFSTRFSCARSKQNSIESPSLAIVGCIVYLLDWRGACTWRSQRAHSHRIALVFINPVRGPCVFCSTQLVYGFLVAFCYSFIMIILALA